MTTTDLHHILNNIKATIAALNRRAHYAEQKRALWAGASPSWLRNSEREQDTFDEDFTDYERQQWEGNGHD